MNKFEEKILYFMTALQDVYKDEENRESAAFQLELKAEDLTEDFTAIVYAQWMLYKILTESDIDILAFTHLVNRLVVQQLCDSKEINNN